MIRSRWDVEETLVVFVPEARGWQPLKYDHHTWETRWLGVCDVILFYIPREMTKMPGLTTNVEFGRLESSGRIVLGTPPEAVHVSYLRQGARAHGAPVVDTLDDAVAASFEVIGRGAQRTAGEREVPLLLWRTPSFADWLSERRAAGHELQGGRLVWAFGPGPTKPLLCWAFQAQISVGSEDRWTSDEMIICPPGGPAGAWLAGAAAASPSAPAGAWPSGAAGAED